MYIWSYELKKSLIFVGLMSLISIMYSWHDFYIRPKSWKLLQWNKSNSKCIHLCFEDPKPLILSNNT